MSQQLKVPKIVLASSSPFRKQLLSKLLIPFSCIAPDIDESPLNNETPMALVKRLAQEKALKIAKTQTDAIIIASDQVAVIDNQIIGKPLNRATAINQLSQANGKKITFYTSLCVYNSKVNTLNSSIEPYHVHFRKLTPSEIEFYVDMEKPFYCAGSFKSEGLGISLFEKLEGDDPNTLIGLPLIKLIQLLELNGIKVLSK